MLVKEVKLEREWKCNVKRNEGELYLQSYPKLRKWINECQICHSKGYKPDMPKHIANPDAVSGYFIRKYFKPLEVNEMSICNQCAKFYSRE